MKDFILLANVNACTYKEFFPLLKEDKVRSGYNFNKTIMFETPEGEKSGPNIAWFVTLPTPGKKQLILTKTYNPQDYPRYDNYDAIEVGRIKDIPYDYEGVMGVPITILGYDLENVEVYECLNDNTPDTRVATIEGKEKYARVLIKKNFEIMGEEVIHNKNTKIEGKEKYRRVLIKKNFEIIRFRKGDDEKDLCVGGEDKYFRILIRQKIR